MDIDIHEDKAFLNIDFAEKKLEKREFVKCNFTNCNFSKSNLAGNEFLDCTFTTCNLSLAEVNNTGFKNIQFIHCKLMGIDFSRCADFLFSASFTHCQLDYSIFFQKKMKKTIFKDCSLKEVDFSEADLSAAIFNNCDLQQATFLRSNLEKTDFRTAYNYAFDPEMNRLKKAKFSLNGVTGLLSKYNLDIE